MELKPIGQHILIKPDEEIEETTKSGLVLTSNREIRQEWGVVVDMGAEVEDAGEFKVGDRVCWKAFLPDEVTYGGERYLLAVKEDLICKMTA